MLGEQSQAQLHVGQLNANVACAHKGRQVTAANQQHVHVDQRLVFGGGFWIVFNTSELDLAFAAFNAKVAFDLDEAEHVEHQAAHQFGGLALGTVQGQFQVGLQASGDLQAGVAGSGRVGGGGCQAVVDHGAVFGGSVDLQAHVIDLNGQAIHTHKRSLVHRGLRRGPAA